MSSRDICLTYMLLSLYNKLEVALNQSLNWQIAPLQIHFYQTPTLTKMLNTLYIVYNRVYYNNNYEKMLQFNSSVPS